MNYKEYLKSLSVFQNYTITDEVNYQYNGEGTALVIKYLSGSNYKDSKILPVQLSVYTNDLETTKYELETFASTYNNSPFIDITDYIQQIYSTPLLLQPFDLTANNYIHNFIISGTLLISSNVKEIKRVYIDGVEYETTIRALNYNTQIDNQKVNNDNINKTNISYATLSFTCSMINKVNTLTNKIKNIRTGVTSIDTDFILKLVYSDNDDINNAETYTMKLDSATINSENQSLPILSLSFIK